MTSRYSNQTHQPSSLWRRSAGVCSALLLASAASVAMAWPWDDEPEKAAASQSQLSQGDVQALIEKGENLESIPKETWKQLLTPLQYKVMWKGGTERPFTGDLLTEKRPGVFVSAGCKIPVFRSDHKFKSGTGWPSFWEALDKDNIVLKTDYSWGMKRVEVLSKCGEHLGHVFEDGPKPTGLRYCINSAALAFIPDAEAAPQQSPVSNALPLK